MCMKRLSARALSTQTLCLFLFSQIFLALLTKFYVVDRGEGLFFGISSESLVQTFPASVLSEHPALALFYNHIQPPMFDAIRAAITQFWSPNFGTLEYFVDLGVFGLYFLLYGFLCVLVFVWILKATRSLKAAWVGSVLWAMHPGAIAMSSFLDGTFLSAIFIAWMIFEICQVDKKNGSIARVVIAATLCFFTRAHFQWFFVPFLVVALLFIGVERKQLAKWVGIFTVLVALYCVKQVVLFGTPYSFGWFGEQLTGSLWIEEVGERTNSQYQASCGAETLVVEVECKEFFANKFPKEVSEIRLVYPDQAHAVSAKHNSEKRWWLSQVQTRIAKQECINETKACITSLFRSVRQNFPEYWIESWDRRNPIVADKTGIPWTKVYYRISNNYFWLIILSCVIFLITSANRSIRPNILPIIGKTLVPLYVFGISPLGNSFDAYEGGRLKFMLEPTIFVFIFVQICSALHHFLLGVRTSSKNDS